MAKWFSLNKAVLGLRISLGLIFLWFGALKLAGYNPVYDIVYASFPFLADGVGNIILGLFETIIGLGLLFNLIPIVVHATLFGHLLGTMSVFVLAPEIVFDPYFPILSLAGEFVFKNITLLMAGFVVLIYTEKTNGRQK